MPDVSILSVGPFIPFFVEILSIDSREFFRISLDRSTLSVPDTESGFQITLQNMIHVVRKGSWQKWEVGNFSVWKFEVRKFPFKLESTNRSWKVFNAVSRNKNFSNFGSNFPTLFCPISFRTFQLFVFQLPFPATCIPFPTVRLDQVSADLDGRPAT